MKKTQKFNRVGLGQAHVFDSGILGEKVPKSDTPPGKIDIISMFLFSRKEIILSLSFNLSKSPNTYSLLLK
jgi:hypothetical protein